VGTFGRVYLVRHARSGALFALKVLKKALVRKLNQARNVEFERAVLAAVRHPFLLRLIATFQTPRRLYLLTEYVHGGELFNLLVEREVLPPAHARFYAACTLAGLAHLHSLGIVYRDLKPENLLLDAAGYIRIVDFGFCKHVAADERTYTLCGTPAYIAYEMAKRTGYAHAVDLCVRARAAQGATLSLPSPAALPPAPHPPPPQLVLGHAHFRNAVRVRAVRRRRSDDDNSQRPDGRARHSAGAGRRRP
jgi:serine/threonine protein kinase